MRDLPEARSDESPIPNGVEFLLGLNEIQGRIAYLRYHDQRPIAERMPEIKRLVNEESKRTLTHLGVL